MLNSRPPAFDPYEQWLGIAPHERPLNHYRLLGLPLFVSDAEAIRAAADERMLHVRTFQSGRRANESQRMLNEIAAAKTCLLDADTKSTYDAVLQGQLASVRSVASAVAPTPPMRPHSPPPPPPIAKSQAVPPVSSVPGNLVSGNSVPGGANQDEWNHDDTVPFYLQPWFPVAVVAGVMFLGVGIWGLAIAIGNSRREVVRGEVTNAVTESIPVQPVDQTPPEEEISVTQEGGGELVLDPSTARLEGFPSLAKRDGEDVIIDITSPDDRLSWLVEIETPAAFRIEATYATTPAAAGGEFVFTTETEETKILTTRDTGGAASFTSERIGFIWLRRSGRHRLSLAPQTIPAGQSLMTLKSLRLIPVTGTSVKGSR